MSENKFILSYSPIERNQISKITKELYLEEINKFTDIPASSVTIRTMYIFEGDNNIEAKIFIINNTHENVNFDEVPFLIMNESGKAILSQKLKLTDAGEIPPKNIRPFSIFFDKAELIGKLTDKSYVAISLGNVNAAVSEKTKVDHFDEKLSPYERTIIENFIKTMPPIVGGDVKFKKFKKGIDEDNNIYSILIISNGLDKDINVDEFKATCVDRVGLIQAFKLVKDVHIAAKASAVVKVIFEKEDIIREGFNIDNCSIAITDGKMTFKKD